MINRFLDCTGVPNAAIFMSGSGSNTRRLLEDLDKQENPCWCARVIVTDRPKTSCAFEIGAEFCVPVIDADIKEFYQDHGIERVSLRDDKSREIREAWTESVRKKLAEYHVDFGVLAGFIPLTNITSDFPCLNVHPGDLTIEREGKRLLVGLHALPIEKALIAGAKSLRSSVIVAQAYTGGGSEMDSGPILGVSEEVTIDFLGNEPEALLEVNRSRPAKRPKGGFGDILERVALCNLSNLKENGDWILFPQVVNDFAAGRFGCNDQGGLYYREGENWEPVKTVVYGRTSVIPVRRED